MNTLLIILAVLGISAVLLAAYVFTVAARTFVSNERSGMHPVLSNGSMDHYGEDRRSGEPVEFPLVVNGIVIARDRRKRRERRLALA